MLSCRARDTFDHRAINFEHALFPFDLPRGDVGSRGQPVVRRDKQKNAGGSSGKPGKILRNDRARLAIDPPVNQRHLRGCQRPQDNIMRFAAKVSSRRKCALIASRRMSRWGTASTAALAKRLGRRELQTEIEGFVKAVPMFCVREGPRSLVHRHRGPGQRAAPALGLNVCRWSRFAVQASPRKPTVRQIVQRPLRSFVIASYKADTTD